MDRSCCRIRDHELQFAALRTRGFLAAWDALFLWIIRLLY
jgi:hypothetical protein